jgi:AmmeMemoRadiSam system protein B
MLTALRELGGAKAELVRHATSGNISEGSDAVVGYAGILFA